MTQDPIQSVAGKVWLAILVLSVGFVPVFGAVQQPNDCCTPIAGECVVVSASDGCCQVPASAKSCCASPGSSAPHDAPREPGPLDENQPCDCTCCKFHTAPAQFAPVALSGPVFPLDSVSLLSIIAPLRPDSTVLSVDIQPPIV